MYNIIYNKIEEQVDSKEGVLTLIHQLIDQPVTNPEFIIVEVENHGSMEVACGMGNDTILFYIPESEDEDIKVSCNATVERAKSDAIKIGHPTEHDIECTFSNTVPIDKGMEVLEAYLEGQEFMNIVDWYSY